MIRFAAGLCLLAMLASSAPHAHSDSEGSARAKAPATSSEGTRPVSIADDDAHDEHSSRPANAGPPCLFCRSKEDRVGDRARPCGPIPAAEFLAERGREPAAATPATLALELHPSRAPPIA